MNKQTPVAIKTILLIVAIAGFVSSGYVLYRRAGYEMASKTVRIVMDSRSIAAAQPPGMSNEDALAEFRKLGIDTVGVYEYSAKKLVRGRTLGMYESPAIYGGKSRPGMLLKGDAIYEIPAMNDMLSAYFGTKPCYMNEKAGWRECNIPAIGSDQLEKLSFGLEPVPSAMKAAPRLYNTPFETKESIALKIAQAADANAAGIIIFDGDAVLGYPNLTGVTAEEVLKHDNLLVGYLELSGQDGEKPLASKLRDRIVEVHGIPEEEMAVTPPAKAVARFRRAVRERGIRVLYVRLYPALGGLQPQESFAKNVEYVKSIKEAIENDGYTLGQVKPLPPFETDVKIRVARAMTVAGAVALVALLLALTGVSLPVWLIAAGLAGGLGAPMALATGGSLSVMVFKLAGLAVACLVPALAVVVFFLPEDRKYDGSGLIFKNNAVAFVAATAITMAGGMMLAAMISERVFFLRIAVFSGVKLAFVMPLAIIALYYLSRTKEGALEFLSSNVRYVEIVAGVLAVAALAIYIMRSGNNSPAEASAVESALRLKLEDIFIARPRTKEFLIGHPALLLAGLFPFAKKRYTVLLVLLAGVIGQISVMNTFCHAHTPIMLTWFRVSLGVLLGLAVGTGLRLVLAPVLFLISADGWSWYPQKDSRDRRES